MWYPDGGGLTAEQRRRREEVRVRAVDLGASIMPSHPTERVTGTLRHVSE
ncbi:hypothetical protein GCM10022384_06980 [Streptomyces marokkonensis]|uniref:Uncharacterized protein n=1 Tax=Streptomyces marokkonensis TaxID=324855 RepID=A0ABP7NXZ8_9ACTN